MNSNPGDISRDETIGGVPTVPRGEPPMVVAGRYRTMRLIARGGMASVFLAEQLALHRPVALKILNPPPGGDADDRTAFERRFQLEAETLATLVHPNIVTVHDYGPTEDGRFFLAMEHIDGPRYTDLLVRGALPVDRTIQLLLQVCGALRYAHKRGVVHRDLKPSNLLIATDADGNEQVKVVDFGLVKVGEFDQSLTREGVVMGSPHCMAPEQVQGGAIDHRADLYALGILLFRSLTGAYPFHGSNATATMLLHLTAEVPRFVDVAPDLRIPIQVEQVVRRCLARRPEDRWPDAATLAQALAACVGLTPQLDTQSQSLTLDEEPGPAPPAPPARLPRWVLLAGAGVLGVAALAGFLLLRAPPPSPVAAPVGASPDVAALLTEGAPPTTGTATDAPAPDPTVDPAADPAAGAAATGTAGAPTDPPAAPAATGTSAAPEATPSSPAPAPMAARPKPPPSRPTPAASPTPPPAEPAPEAPPGYMGLPDDLK